MPGFAEQRGAKIGVQIPPAQSPENLTILGAFFRVSENTGGLGTLPLARSRSRARLW